MIAQLARSDGHNDAKQVDDIELHDDSKFGDATHANTFGVGCGYSSYSYEPGKVLVIRLSDGYSWELPSTGCTGPNFTGDFCFEETFAITCEEIFLRGGIPMNIARVEISALGAPNPPEIAALVERLSAAARWLRWLARSRLSLTIRRAHWRARPET